MSEHEKHEILKASGRALGHVAAVVLGLVFMILGLGLGVTLVALPVGLVVGLGGFLLFLWGLFAPPGTGPRRPVSK